VLILSSHATYPAKTEERGGYFPVISLRLSVRMKGLGFLSYIIYSTGWQSLTEDADRRSGQRSLSDSEKARVNTG